MAAGGGGAKKGRDSGDGSKKSGKESQGPNRDGSAGGPGTQSPKGRAQGPNRDGSTIDTNPKGTPANGPVNSDKTYTDVIDDPVAKEYAARQDDVSNVGESWDDGFAGFANELGHVAMGALGIGEREQTFSEVANDLATRPDKAPMENGSGDPTNQAHYGLDLATLAAGIAGLATGNIGLGLATDIVSNEVGRPLDIDLGTDVLGGSTTSGAGTSEPGGATDGHEGGDTPSSAAVAKPKTPKKPDVEASDPATDVVTPASGVGVDLITQSSGGTGTDLGNVDPAKRRRRGTLGGLGASGLAL